jgi:hypothetical protein
MNSCIAWVTASNLDLVFVTSGFICWSCAGGTHHAFADRGEGFCVFNDIAVSCAYALAVHKLERILVIDLGMHFLFVVRDVDMCAGNSNGYVSALDKIQLPTASVCSASELKYDQHAQCVCSCWVQKRFC